MKLFAIIPLLFAQIINTGGYRKVFTPSGAPLYTMVPSSYSDDYGASNIATHNITCSGNEFVVILVYNNYTVSTGITVTATANTVASVSNYESGTRGQAQTFYISNCAAGSDTLIATIVGGGQYTFISTVFYTAAGGAARTVDAAGTWDDNNTAFPACSVMTGGAGELLVSTIGFTGFSFPSWSSTGAFTVEGNNVASLSYADDANSTSGANSFGGTLSSTAQWLCGLVAFK